MTGPPTFSWPQKRPLSCGFFYLSGSAQSPGCCLGLCVVLASHLCRGRWRRSVCRRRIIFFLACVMQTPYRYFLVSTSRGQCYSTPWGLCVLVLICRQLRFFQTGSATTSATGRIWCLCDQCICHLPFTFPLLVPSSASASGPVVAEAFSPCLDTNTDLSLVRHLVEGVPGQSALCILVWDSPNNDKASSHALCVTWMTCDCIVPPRDTRHFGLKIKSDTLLQMGPRSFCRPASEVGAGLRPSIAWTDNEASKRRRVEMPGQTAVEIPVMWRRSMERGLPIGMNQTRCRSLKERLYIGPSRTQWEVGRALVARWHSSHQRITFGHMCVSFLFLVRRATFRIGGVPCSITSSDSRWYYAPVCDFHCRGSQAASCTPPGTRSFLLLPSNSSHRCGSSVLLFSEFWPTRTGTGLGPNLVWLVHVIFLSRPSADAPVSAVVVFVRIGQNSANSNILDRNPVDRLHSKGLEWGRVINIAIHTSGGRSDTSGPA